MSDSCPLSTEHLEHHCDDGHLSYTITVNDLFNGSNCGDVGNSVKVIRFEYSCISGKYINRQLFYASVCRQRCTVIIVVTIVRTSQFV